MSATPKDRKYSKTHEWFRAEGDLVTIGISKFAADELTDITFVDLPAVGTKITAGKPFGVVESVKATSDLISSVSGEVVRVNERLANEPELVNNDSFGEGWMIQVRVSDLAALNELMDADAYDRMLAQG
ncbi:MAG TPA: glycine cleavage system protein GcvH [Phycisphaerae bacterium]|nr:glycine cleavage system protein GcvH [Phycisphaerae bacterium]HOJ76138.1 glycine cleavage system protein GcvH [Phycisphaerae bacterium]HOM53123.1 glycine cleavage system protein GcvH [Phycisphaerae bacterium]HON65758.1 glycine cleavage system protein GcvH [Phycisphaerae bacterium]HOQ85507.1 glycine cleavage system protein GcvH [Phycisphaerae bacterium]